MSAYGRIRLWFLPVEYGRHHILGLYTFQIPIRHIRAFLSIFVERIEYYDQYMIVS